MVVTNTEIHKYKGEGLNLSLTWLDEYKIIAVLNQQLLNYYEYQVAGNILIV